MRFLIEFDRKRQRLVTFKAFSDAQKELAATERLALELRLRAAGTRHEVVILDAQSEDALKLTHGRYFEDPPAPMRGPLRVAEAPPGNSDEN